MRIFLIDDETIVRSTLCEFLQELGHHVAAVESGDRFLDHLSAGGLEPDVIIIDLRTPGPEGANLLRKLHHHCPSLPILVLSGTCPGISPVDAVAAGVHAYLRKPIRLAEIELVLMRLAESRPRPSVTVVERPTVRHVAKRGQS